MTDRYDYTDEEYLEELTKRLTEGDPDLSMMLLDSVQEAADGCSVEPDGVCPHGHQSPAMLLGII